MKRLLILIFLCFSACASAQEKSVYDAVHDALSAFPHRLPGTPEYYKSIDTLESILNRNGVTTHRQNFPTYVPEVVRNVFTVDGADVTLYPLSPANIALTTTGEKPIHAELVYLTKDELSKKYSNIDGRIVILDWGEYDYTKILLSEGAKAFVFVGNDTATQWDVAHNISQFSAQFPFFYITREEALRHKLLDKPTKERPHNAVLSVVTRWKQADGVNLWAEIKSGEQKIFTLNQPEALILGARLDTFGAVPGLDRGDRKTANIALLAQTAADLAKTPHDRTAFILFYGAAFNAHDGLRHFYFPLSIANSRKEPTVTDYGKGFRQELSDTEKLLETLETAPVVKDENSFQFRVRMLLRDAIVARDNLLNYEMGANKQSLWKNANRKKEKDVTPAEIKKLDAESALLNAEKEKMENMKRGISNLRRAINERVIPDSLLPLLKKPFLAQVRTDLRQRLEELKSDIRMSDSWEEVATATAPYAFLGAFFFDFASDAQPFSFVCRSYEAVHFSQETGMDSYKYNKFFNVMEKLLPELELQKSAAPILKESLNPASNPESFSSRSLLCLPSAAGLCIKLNAFTFRNVPGDYDFDELPGKRTYSLSGLRAGMEELFTRLLNEPEFSMSSMLDDNATYDAFLNYRYRDGTYFGKRYELLGPDGKSFDRPAAGAFATKAPKCWDRIYPLAGFSMEIFGKVNSAGYVTMPLAAAGSTWTPSLSWKDSNAMLFDEFGRTIYINTSNAPNKLFRCYGGPMVYNYAPLTSNFVSPLKFLNGANDSGFTNNKSFQRVATGDGYSFIDKNVNAKIYFFQETFMLGSTKDNPGGTGIPFTPEFLQNVNPSRMSIESTILLNLQRLEKIHSRNIFNSVIEGYHDRAEQHQIDAEKARADGDINLARAHEMFGQTVAIRAYRPLKTMIDDLVKSVLILMILTIPFAFAMERLVIGSTNIYKQMGWITVFFTATFLLLFFTHPAFALSQAPLIIFIAFFIIVLSLVVIFIVMGRFRSELRILQGLDTSAHRINSENSVLLAAILIGVSSMRNRPVKTFLTILTVVLLTFTIISFASFESTGSVRPTYFGDSAGEVRIEHFLANHVDLLQTTLQSIRDMYSKDYEVFERYACYDNPFYQNKSQPAQKNTVYNPNAKGERIMTLEAVVGFEPGEARRCEKLRKLMPKLSEKHNASDPPGVYLSTHTAKRLGLAPGDKFFLRSMPVRLDGVFHPADLDSFAYLDNAKIAPPNFQATMDAEDRGLWAVVSAEEDTSNYVFSSPDAMLLTDAETAKKINGFRNAILLYPREGRHPDLITDATRIAEVAYGIVYSNTANGIYRHFFTRAFAASGLGNLIVPLLLGGLIILSSLLGSIADREREIFTFSALGLSPKDVSVLFFAESGVYAVIGGLGGYLLSQVTTAVLNFLASHGILEAPEINYSSMSTVYTILIVMGLVFLSTIYPAIKAGRSANPDIARKWKMPPPDGDKLVFQFPFTVSATDFGGILLFIGEHFKNHSDSSLGAFAASDVRISKGDGEFTQGYLLSADLTLAPFDLGVAEKFHMYSAPSDIEGIDVVTVAIQRLDGSRGAWLRGNHRFVDEIRNQFLLWRSLPVETILHYRKNAAETMNNRPEPAKGV